jgi:hypothetical protein
MGSREATELVIERMRSRPGMVGAAVLGTALTVPFAASAAWATKICACGGGGSTVAPPTPDVRGMSPDAAERWLGSAPSPEPTPAHPPTPVPEPPSPPPTTTTTPPPPEPVEPPPDVSGMSPDAAERWLEAEAEPQIPVEGETVTREERERERRFDRPPGCIPVQGPYLNEADRPCSFPDGTQVPTGQIGTQPVEAWPCVRVQGPYLNEADRPCAFPDGREIPSGLVVEPPPPEPAECATVEGYDEDEAGLCAYPDGRTSTTDDPERTPAPPVEDFQDPAEGGRGEELVSELLEPSDEEFQQLVDDGTIGQGATNRSYFPIEPAPGDGVVVVDFFIPQDRSVVLQGDDRELQDPIRATSSRPTRA